MAIKYTSRKINMISYCITVYNEYDEISRLLSAIKEVLQNNDEIVVVQTHRNESDKQSEIYDKIEKTIKSYTNKHFIFHFDNNFADMKNFMSSKADIQNKYIINFDADEIMDPSMLIGLRRFLSESDTDVFYLPRVNIVDGITSEDINKWSWNLNEQGWINWPDYQSRIYKHNGLIKWTGNVHEHLVGYNSASAIEADGSIYIYHRKDILKQRQQNSLYDSI